MFWTVLHMRSYIFLSTAPITGPLSQPTDKMAVPMGSEEVQRSTQTFLSSIEVNRMHYVSVRIQQKVPVLKYSL